MTVTLLARAPALMLFINAPTAASTSPSNLFWSDCSPAWVSKELRFTSQTLVGTLALIKVETSESCSPMNEPVGDFVTIGPSTRAVEKRSEIDDAAADSKGTSDNDERPRRGNREATWPHGTRTPPTSTIEATIFWPTLRGGNV